MQPRRTMPKKFSTWHSQRMTVIIGESDDFRPFAGLVDPTARPPFLPP
jgi:hypothetical protein